MREERGVAINDWWSADLDERFWMETAGRTDLGAELQKHWPMPRMSFETAVRRCLTEEVPPSCAESEADNSLAGSEAAFKLFSSWQQTPTIRYGRPVSLR
jgi:hypothetical protein